MDTQSLGASAPVQAVLPAIFQFHSTEVRTIQKGGQVWFIADDVVKALGYRESRDMTRVLDEDEAARTLCGSGPRTAPSRPAKSPSSPNRASITPSSNPASHKPALSGDG